MGGKKKQPRPTHLEEADLNMDYFSPRANWLSMTSESDSYAKYDDVSAPCPDPGDSTYVPLEEVEDDSRARRKAYSRHETEPQPITDANIHAAHAERLLLKGRKRQAVEQSEKALKLRHAYVVYENHWEYGPQLFDDNLRLARLQTRSEGALEYYCHARFIASELVRRDSKPRYLMAWLEIDLIIAEVQMLKGCTDSSRIYAYEGLDLIKHHKFDSGMDSRVTTLALRFLKLIGKA